MIARTWLRRLLALGCLALGAVVALELTAAPKTAPADRAAPRPAALADGNRDTGFTMPPANSYAEIETRPLFSDTRRPPAFAATSTEAHPNFVLVGTILSHDERDALIKHGQPARVDRVTEGQSVEGWAVHSILTDRVIFMNAGVRLEIKAKDDNALATTRRKRREAADASGAPTGE